MVKGVNKTVIEVNNTGNSLFEKIVFYVSPQYGNYSAQHLNDAADEFIIHFEEGEPSNSLRDRYKEKSRRKKLVIALCILLVTAAVGLTLYLVL